MKMNTKQIEEFAKKEKIKFPLFQKRKYIAAVTEELSEAEDLLFFCEAKKEGKDGTLMITSKRVAWIDNGILHNSTVSTNMSALTSVTREEKNLKVRMEFFDASGSFAVEPFPLYGRKIEETIAAARE